MTTEKRQKREKEKSENEQNVQQQKKECMTTDVSNILTDTMLIIAILLKLLRNFNKESSICYEHKKRNRNIFMTNMGRKSNNYSTTDVDSIQKNTAIRFHCCCYYSFFFLSLVFNCEFVKRHCTLAKWQNISIHKFIRQ